MPPTSGAIADADRRLIVSSGMQKMSAWQGRRQTSCRAFGEYTARGESHAGAAFVPAQKVMHPPDPMETAGFELDPPRGRLRRELPLIEDQVCGADFVGEHGGDSIGVLTGRTERRFACNRRMAEVGVMPLDKSRPQRAENGGLPREAACSRDVVGGKIDAVVDVAPSTTGVNHGYCGTGRRERTPRSGPDADRAPRCSLLHSSIPHVGSAHAGR